MRDKPFTKLPIAQVLKPQISAMLGRWLTINDQDKFTGRIYYTVREMFTVIKNQLADVPTSQDYHSNHVELKTDLPRFDKMITDLNNKRRQKANSQIRLDAVQNERRRKAYFEGFDFKIGSFHMDKNPDRLDPNQAYLGPPMIDTKATKQSFLKGDKDVVLYCDPNAPKSSSYQQNLTGL